MPHQHDTISEYSIKSNQDVNIGEPGHFYPQYGEGAGNRDTNDSQKTILASQETGDAGPSNLEEMDIVKQTLVIGGLKTKLKWKRSGLLVNGRSKTVIEARLATLRQEKTELSEKIAYTAAAEDPWFWLHFLNLRQENPEEANRLLDEENAYLHARHRLEDRLWVIDRAISEFQVQMEVFFGTPTNSPSDLSL